MKKQPFFYILILFLLFLLVACASRSGSGQRTSTLQGSKLLEEARTSLITASPDSLNYSITILKDTPEGASEAGNELLAMS